MFELSVSCYEKGVAHTLVSNSYSEAQSDLSAIAKLQSTQNPGNVQVSDDIVTVRADNGKILMVAQIAPLAGSAA